MDSSRSARVALSRVASLAAIAVVAATVGACGDETPDAVVLPGFGADRSPVALTAPPVPTTLPPIGSATTAPSSEPTAEASDPDEPSGGAETGGSDDPATTVPPPSQDPATDATTVPPATTAPPAPTTTAPEIVYLRRGDEGPEVASIQRRLIALDYLPEGADTGVFDGATADALIDFQAQYGLIVDGIFGPETDRALNAAAASVD